MSIKLSKGMVLPAAVLLLGSVSLAQTPPPPPPASAPAAPAPAPTIEQRKGNQQDRIANGVKSGQLTAGETAKLQNQQRNINRQVAADRAANGGKLTAGEKKQINKEQNAASKNIYDKKHNARTQPGTKK